MSALDFGDDEEIDESSLYGAEAKYDKEESRPDRWDVASDGTPPEADPSVLKEIMDVGGRSASDLAARIEERTVDTLDTFEEEPEQEDAFFLEGEGANATSTIVTRYDLEKAVPTSKKKHFKEKERYWVNKPNAFISIFKSRKDNEYKYYIIEPYRNPIEKEISGFFERKLKTAIKYEAKGGATGSEEERKEVIEEKARELLNRYNLYDPSEFEAESSGGFLSSITGMLGGGGDDILDDENLEGVYVRPEPDVLQENDDRLTAHQVQKLLYYLKRNFIAYERIDPIKYDINVEDISCNGYDEPVFVYHGEHEQIITNIKHGQEQLDNFVVKLAQRSGKGISKRDPQVDATLPDGSRAQLTLGAEVSDKGTNYTIRQFKDVPFTPVDLINWRTFGLSEMAFLWLAIENNMSMIFAGGTASGKTTSLNAVSLFIPSGEKVVSIEDTREVELPQRNWIASVTRPSFSGQKGDVDEFALLEAALRQRPDYIVMGEIRGEEGRTLFQVMSTGHTTYTTFHADSVGEVLKRFTTEPINVSKTLFTALDLVSIQTSTRVEGKKVRRNENLTEINNYDAENDEVNVKDIYEWDPERDVFRGLGRDGTVQGTETFERIMFDRGWDEEETWNEIRKRKLVLAYMMKNGINTYRQVAATLQAFINDQDTVLTLVANNALEDRLEDLRDMESVMIDVDPEDEEGVPRPDPDEEMAAKCERVMNNSRDLLEPYEGRDPQKALLQDSLPSPSDMQDEQDIEPDVDKGGLKKEEEDTSEPEEGSSGLFDSRDEEPTADG